MPVYRDVQNDRDQVVRELDGFLLVLRDRRMPREFVAGVEAARRFLAAPANEPWHGTPGGYTHHYCRRKCCRDAMQKYREDRREKAGIPANAQRVMPKPPKQTGVPRCSLCLKWLQGDDYLKRVVAGRQRKFCTVACELEFIVKRAERERAKRKEAA